jgi:hypothetical protein
VSRQTLSAADRRRFVALAAEAAARHNIDAWRACVLVAGRYRAAESARFRRVARWFDGLGSQGRMMILRSVLEGRDGRPAKHD